MRFLLFSVLVFSLAACKVARVQSDAQPITHEGWTAELQKYVSDAGWVDYAAWQQDTTGLKSYLSTLEQHHANNNWTDDQQMAYWINAYNAYTVLLILRHYPVESIKDIKNGIPFVNTVWDIKFIEIEGHKYDLNNIEHGILREYWSEPRIHFAINCASVSCPKLLNVAYEAATLDEQLDQQARAFIDDPNRNKLSKDKLELSKIFSWFKGDFTDKMSIPDYIRQYTDTEISASPTIDHLNYNWKLNSPANAK